MQGIQKGCKPFQGVRQGEKCGVCWLKTKWWGLGGKWPALATEPQFDQAVHHLGFLFCLKKLVAGFYYCANENITE